MMTKNLIDNNNNLYVIPLCLLLSLYLLFILDQGLNNLESKTVLELRRWCMHEFYQVVLEQGGYWSRDLQGFSKKKKKIRVWCICSYVSVGLFSRGDILFVNRWIGLKFFVKILGRSSYYSTGGIFNLSFYGKVLVWRKLLQTKVL